MADDDAALRELAEKVLTMFGYTVIMAVDGCVAVALFRANRDRTDLVIPDIIMRKMSGKEAFDEIRKVNPAVRGMFISGYTSDIIQKRGLLDQGIEFIPEPLNLKQLLIKIRDLLGAEAAAVTRDHEGSIEVKVRGRLSSDPVAEIRAKSIVNRNPAC